MTNQMHQSAWEKAFRAKRKVFFEAATETLRQCPENYLLAIRRDGRWIAAPDKASTINAHSLGIVLHDNANIDGDALAAAVQFAFWGE